MAFDPKHLLRALRLGFDEIELGPVGHPACCRDRDRIYVWMPLPDQTPAETTQEEPPTMSRHHELNGSHERDVGLPKTDEAIDPLAEAEVVRGLLAEAQSRLSRLLGSLKRHRRRERAVAAAVEAVRQLRPPL
jgi:hypothetical protein